MEWDVASESRSVLERGLSLSIRSGVKAFVSTGESVLLVKERHSDGETFWTLPGGGLEPGEEPVDGLRRELREELDCDVLVGDARATVWYAHRSTDRALTAYRVYDCGIVSRPMPSAAEGILEYRWVPVDGLPAGTLPQVRLLYP